MFQVVFYAITALWSGLMGAALIGMLLLSSFGDRYMGAPYVAFEVLSVLGLCWIPVSLFSAARIWDKQKEKIVMRKNWAVLTALGPCWYYVGVFGVATIVLQFYPAAFDSSRAAYFAGLTAIYLVLLAIASSFQAAQCGRNLTVLVDVESVLFSGN
jgi:putative Mn2+ efflux pump MntP